MTQTERKELQRKSKIVWDERRRAELCCMSLFVGVSASEHSRSALPSLFWRHRLRKHAAAAASSLLAKARRHLLLLLLLSKRRYRNLAASWRLAIGNPAMSPKGPAQSPTASQSVSELRRFYRSWWRRVKLWMFHLIDYLLFGCATLWVSKRMIHQKHICDLSFFSFSQEPRAYSCKTTSIASRFNTIGGIRKFPWVSWFWSRSVSTVSAFVRTCICLIGVYRWQCVLLITVLLESFNVQTKTILLSFFCFYWRGVKMDSDLSFFTTNNNKLFSLRFCCFSQYQIVTAHKPDTMIPTFMTKFCTKAKPLQLFLEVSMQTLFLWI